VVAVAMSAARDEILGRIRAALDDAPAAEVVPRDYRRSTGAGVELLLERLLDYKAEVRRVAASAMAAAVEEECRGKRIVVPSGLPVGWRPSDAVEDEGFDARALDAFDGAVTGCTLAIAETGTLVLSAGPAEGRRALTLVPDLHICVVLEEQIVDTVPAAFDRLDPTRPLTFVSGPSATSDIELNRVEGVHGPRRLHVLIVQAGDGTASSAQSASGI
jgi:L-lactate dehydrogenase complex protein LldG